MLVKPFVPISKCVKLLYTNPGAEVFTNYIISKPIMNRKGRRQGYPSSPLLFIIAIEPLPIDIWSHTEISGTTIGLTDHCIALYADNIFVFLRKLEKSIPALLELINTFGKLW